MKKLFIVYTPPYGVKSAGVVSMHRLAYELYIRGERVTVDAVHDPFNNSGKLNPEWDIPILQYPESIAIYPEITKGNPLGCSTVARIIMHIPGYWGGPKTYNPTDILWTYSTFWNKKSGLNLPDDRILTVPVININEFKDNKYNRTKKYFYRGKGKQPDDPRINAENIIKENHPDNVWNKLLAEKLNNAEILYSYDNISAINVIALLCGCPVVILPDKTYLPSEIIPILLPGMGYGLEEEWVARSTINPEKVKDILKEEELVFQEQLTNFINVMQNT